MNGNSHRKGFPVNAQTLAKMAYSAPGQPTQTPRSTEYEIFSRITYRLRQASALGAAGFASLASAMHDNRQLWTTLAVDVADKDNQLPPATRARIFYLAEFTTHHTRQVLAGKATADALIEINTTIMRGLKGSGIASTK
jgi:flagellar protein FlaF